MVLRDRTIDFTDLNELFSLPYLEDKRSDDPEQYRIIGFVNGQVTTFIIEYREDPLEELIWVVTAWKSTPVERQAYEKEIG